MDVNAGEFVDRKFEYTKLSRNLFIVASSLLLGMFSLPVIYIEVYWQWVLLAPFLLLNMFFIRHGIQILPKTYAEVEGTTIRHYEGEKLKDSFDIYDIEKVTVRYFLFMVELKSGEVSKIPQFLVDSDILYAILLRYRIEKGEDEDVEGS